VKISIQWFVIYSILQFILGYSMGGMRVKPIETITKECYKPTIVNDLSTWHRVKCPFKGEI